MDGTIINTEDIYTEAALELLAQYGKGPLTWDIKLELQGLPGPEASKKVVEFYQLPVTPEEYVQQSFKIQENKWQKAQLLPGALELLQTLKKNNIPIALGTSSNKKSYAKKVDHLKEAFLLFDGHIVTGDDPRIPPGKGKPHADIWHVCLKSLNDERKEKGLEEIRMEECLIFEDGIPGVYSGINANAYVIWIPHLGALGQLKGKEKEIIGNKGEILKSLADFDGSKYGL